MTSSKQQRTARRRVLAAGLASLLGTSLARAGLGEGQAAVDRDSQRMRAQHTVARASRYAVHELSSADGSRLRQYVGGNGRVFAVSWHTLYKPDLNSLLGSAFATYDDAARRAARQGGVQRQFRHDGNDLVMQSSAHLNVYAGYAYRPSLLPAGVSPQSLGLG